MNTSCQCFQIGGPFIAEDPDCPVHGIAAQRAEKELTDLLQQAEYPCLSFYWNTHADEVEREQANANALMEAAITGGMSPADAKRAVEQVFLAGWSAGSDDERYISQD